MFSHTCSSTPSKGQGAVCLAGVKGQSPVPEEGCPADCVRAEGEMVVRRAGGQGGVVPKDICQDCL